MLTEDQARKLIDLLWAFLPTDPDDRDVRVTGDGPLSRSRLLRHIQAIVSDPLGDADVRELMTDLNYIRDIDGETEGTVRVHGGVNRGLFNRVRQRVELRPTGLRGSN